MVRMKVVSSRLVAIFWSTYRQHRRPGRGPWPSALVVVLQCRSGLLLKPDKNVSRVVGWVRGRIGRGVHIWGVLPIRHPPRSLNFSGLCLATRARCNLVQLVGDRSNSVGFQHIRSVADHLRNIPLQEKFIKRRLNILLCTDNSYTSHGVFILLPLMHLFFLLLWSFIE